MLIENIQSDSMYMTDIFYLMFALIGTRSEKISDLVLWAAKKTYP